MQRTMLLGLVVALGTFAAVAYAENRVLIIGIGPGYGRNSIVGPERDVELVRSLAKQLGFTESQMKVLRDKEATKAAIIAGLKWVDEGVKEGERALVYFSGHGTQVPTKDSDTDDGCMAALVPVDEKLLLAKELNGYLQPLRQRAKVAMFIDACFSGSITKALYDPEEEHLSKYYEDKSARKCNQAINLNKSLAVFEDKATGGGPATNQLVAITATASNEVAWGDVTGSGKGSLFTQSLADIATESRGQEPRLTFHALCDRAAVRIQQVAERYNKIRHTPQLRGNPELFHLDLTFAAASPSRHAEAGRQEGLTPEEYFDRFVRNSQFFVTFEIPQNQKQFPLGKDIIFAFRSGKDGYLNLVELEPDRKVQVLFPNRYNQQNQVKGYQRIEIPKDIGGFRFRAQEPVGKSRIIALVTRQPWNLYQQNQGKILESFKELTVEEVEKGMRSVGIVPESAPGPADETREFGAIDVRLEVVKGP
jgi:metacaspase-1